MKVLYIYGWNSSQNSETVRNLQEMMPNHEVVSVSYDQKNPVEATKFFNQYIIDNDINIVVASSFGAFIGLNIGHSIYKFLINPCLKPSEEVSKLNDVSLNFINQCKQLENKEKIVDDEDMRFTTAFFAQKDELFSFKDQYIELGYFKQVDLKNEHHRLSLQGLKKVVDEIEKIC